MADFAEKLEETIGDAPELRGMIAAAMDERGLTHGQMEIFFAATLKGRGLLRQFNRSPHAPQGFTAFVVYIVDSETAGNEQSAT